MAEPTTTIIAVYPRHEDADAAVKTLADAGIELKQISVIGKGYHTEEKVMGFYNMGDRMQVWGSRGAFWGALWGMLFGGMYLVVPVVGPVVVLGYVATTLLATLEGALLGGGLSAIGGALSGLGVPEDSVVRYETELKADNFLIMAHGTPEDIEKARASLKPSDPSRLDIYDGVSS